MSDPSKAEFDAARDAMDRAVPDPMPLYQALRLLAEVHTRPDDLTGFVVLMGARPEYWHSGGVYIRAWEAVHEFLSDPSKLRARDG